MDDILVFGRNRDKHDKALENTLAAIANKQFRLNTGKCEFQCRAITFLGLRITSAGVHPNPARIAPLKEVATPTTLKQTQAFLGAVNYISEFIPHLANKAEPLRLLTPKGVPFILGPE